MLDMTRPTDGVKPPACEQVGDGAGTSRKDPRHLVLVWRGGGAPSVAAWLCWDAAAAYMQTEHMAGLRNGDSVILYALNWQAQWWGRC